jgi:hypothetical protein
MAGLAQGAKVTSALERVGVVPDAYIWRWRPGMQGGAFPQHQELNGTQVSDILDFGPLPQGDVNGDWCQCQIQTRWRDERGRFAPGPAA